MVPTTRIEAEKHKNKPDAPVALSKEKTIINFVVVILFPSTFIIYYYDNTYIN